MSQDRISVVEPNGIQRTRPLTGQGLTIGRGTENDLVLGYSVVSRNHARITCQGQNYYVTDLGSANGTYLGPNRLEPNVPTIWKWGVPLKIGDVTINLIRVEPQPAEVLTTGATFVGLSDELGPKPASRRPRAWVLWIVLIAVLLIAVAIVLSVLLLR